MGFDMTLRVKNLASRVTGGVRMPEFSVSAGLARGLVDFAASRGADRAALLAEAEITEATLADQDNRIPFPGYIALMRVGQRLSRDPALALHYGASMDLSEISIAGLIAQASESFAEMLALINRYGRLVVEVNVGKGERFRLARADDGLWLTDTRPDPNSFPELTEATMARFVCGASRWIDPGVVTAVRVTHPAPAYAEEYERVLGAPVAFAAAMNAVRIDEAGLTRRKPQQPRYVFGILSSRADDLLRELEQSRTTRGRVEHALMPVLHKGETSMETIAAQLGVSRATLLRRLKSEGVTFDEVRDDLRRTLALHYLAGAKASVNETAYLVGFSDPGAFSRAFKRWTGSPPRNARP